MLYLLLIRVRNSLLLKRLQVAERIGRVLFPVCICVLRIWDVVLIERRRTLRSLPSTKTGSYKGDPVLSPKYKHTAGSSCIHQIDGNLYATRDIRLVLVECEKFRQISKKSIVSVEDILVSVDYLFFDCFFPNRDVGINTATAVRIV